MNSRRAALAFGCACLALAWVIVLGAQRRAVEDRRSLVERLVGPFAGLAASAQWVRADLALREGRIGTFCERAETALALAPADPQAWIYYANTLIWARAAPDRERRESWVRAGIELLGRAERECANPAEVWAYEGNVFFALALLPAEERPWPGEERELLEHSLEAFGRARALGHPRAAVLEEALRKRLADLGR